MASLWGQLGQSPSAQGLCSQSPRSTPQDWACSSPSPAHQHGVASCRQLFPATPKVALGRPPCPAMPLHSPQLQG